MSILPRSLREPTSHSSSSTKRFKIICTLVATSTLLLTAFYLRADESVAFISSSQYEDAIQVDPKLSLGTLHSSSQHDPPLGDAIEVDPKLSLGALHRVSHTRLWSYATALNPTDGWGWVGTQRREGYRRPSWGGMSDQGPKAHVRQNMLEGKQYLTTFPEAGWNNEVMETCNLMAVALRSNRIPVLAPLVPDEWHLGHKDSFLSVSEIFDFTEFVAHYNVPVIDLFELKVGNMDWITIADRHRSVVYDGEHERAVINDADEMVMLTPGVFLEAEEPEFDRVQCWNVYLPVQEEQGNHIGTLWPAVIEHTPLPISAYADRPRKDNSYSTISLPRTAEAVLAYSKPGDTLPADSVARLEELHRDPSNMAPDDPFGCLSRAYYLHLHPETEDIQDDWRNGVGAWDEVGKYLKFQPGLVTLAQDLLRHLLGVHPDETMPPYMAVHIRRTDLMGDYRNMTQREWAHQAWKLLHELKNEHGIHVEHIVFTTDEEDEEWLDVLRDLGWTHVDHRRAKTTAKLGWWFPTILDSAILSSSNIFLGVPFSTMSILPYRRVLDWQGGIARFVKDPKTYHIPDEWEWARDW